MTYLFWCGRLYAPGTIVRTGGQMRKRERLHLRWAQSDATLVRSAASKLDMSISELVRRAAVAAAIAALRQGTAPPAEPMAR